MKSDADAEIDALERITVEILKFPPDAQARMLTYIVRRVCNDNSHDLSFIASTDRAELARERETTK